MCAISAVMQGALNWPPTKWQDQIAREQFQEDMRRAKRFDVETGQPDCENDEKRKAIQAIADKLGVKISFPDDIGKASA